MNKPAVLALVTLSLLTFPAYSNVPPSTLEAQTAAKAWLALTDAGKYGQSWDTAAAYFQQAITKPNWEQALKASRSPLGKLKSRQLKSATFAKSLPGAPDGEYVVIQYNTQFEKKAQAIETVTPMHEPDGSWKVSGYYIK